MNITKCIYTSVALLGATLALSSCDDAKPISGGGLIEQSAKLEVIANNAIEIANPYTTRSFELSEAGVMNTSLQLRVHLSMPAAQETKISIVADEAAAKQYGKGDVRVLPSSMISIPKEIAPIHTGSIVSDPIKIEINLTEEIEYDDTYTFALRLAPIEGAHMASPNDVVIYDIVRRENKILIKQVTRITREVYFELQKDFSHYGDFTMECLVNVEKFRTDGADSGEALITTLMGIEGGTLLRFGDFGSGNKIQAAGYNVTNFTFEPNQWYHIAFTYTSSNRECILYIDGQEIAKFPNSASIVPSRNKWYIGRSWSDNRGLPGKLAEVRVWTTARTQQEIQESMLEVDPKNPALLAYWKMNSAGGNTITDFTGHGYDLLQVSQPGGTPKDVDVITLDPALDGVEK